MVGIRSGLGLRCAGFLFVLTTVAGAGAPGGAGQRAALPHLRPDGHLALAWLYGGTGADYRAQIEAMAGATVVSPTWWYLDLDHPGQITDDADPGLVAWAQQRGLAVWPLFGNHIDADVTDQVLRDPALRRQVVGGVVEAVVRAGADGVNVDFENLHDRTAPLLTQLVAELESALPGKIVSVDVTAMTDTWVLDNWSTAFDRAGLGTHADYVMLMAYDQHNSLRRNGPVAGLQWVSESTEFLLRTVPAHKIVLGLPFYSRDWADEASATQGVELDATLGMAAMAGRLAERSQGAVYDEIAGQDLHTYVDERGRTHRVWLEDPASIQRKTGLVGQFGLAGTAAWRAGFEQPEVWTAIDQVLTSSAAPAVAGQPGQPVQPAIPPQTAVEPAVGVPMVTEDPAAAPTVTAPAPPPRAPAPGPGPFDAAVPAVAAASASAAGAPGSRGALMLFVALGLLSAVVGAQARWLIRPRGR